MSIPTGALHTDLYQLTMMQGYYLSDLARSEACFDLFFRRNPFNGGYAIHGTGYVGMLGRPASHGCIRLATGNAAKLFAMVKQEGAAISITGAPPHQMIAKGKGKKTYVAAKKGKKKNVAIAGKRGKANPLAYAPTKRTSAPSVKQFQANPAGR